MTAVRSFTGFGASPTSLYLVSVCGTKYNACYFCCADAPFFRLTVNLSGRLPMFRHRIWSYATAPVCLIFYWASAQFLCWECGSFMKSVPPVFLELCDCGCPLLSSPPCDCRYAYRYSRACYENVLLLYNRRF